MSITDLLHEGIAHQTPLEKFADKILYAPRKMWGKSVKIQLKNNSALHSVPAKESFHQKLWGSLKDEKKSDGQVIALGAVYSIFYLLSSTALALPLSLGLSLKKIALQTNRKAYCYNKIVQAHLQLERQREKKNQLEMEREQTDQKIKNMETFLETPDPDLTPKVAASWQLEKLTQKNQLEKAEKKIAATDQKIAKFQQELSAALKMYHQLSPSE